MQTSRSKSELYVHIAWGTKWRATSLVAQVEGAVYRSVERQVGRMGCEILAIGGAADHVHLLLRVPPSEAVSKIVQMAKSVSTKAARERSGHGEFEWHEGFAAISVSRSHVVRVQKYVEGQAERHQSGRLWPEWEKIAEDMPGEISRQYLSEVPKQTILGQSRSLEPEKV